MLKHNFYPVNPLCAMAAQGMKTYAIARNIGEEPAFAWWVPYILRKRDVIILAVNSRVCKTSHKYGIEVPSSVRHAIEIDQRNKNTLWQNALAKEMGNVCVAFEILDRNAKAPPGWYKASGHIIFDLKMDFTRKARWVKDGHKTPNSTTASFSGVVYRDSIRIALTHAALLGLPVIGADICNAYLQAQSLEKHFIICGPEFGIENEGRVALIWRALYGGKVAGRDFWHHLQIVWGNLALLVHVLIQMYGLGCQNERQGRSTMNMHYCMSMMC
jgi:hypothetical protein